MESDRTEQFNKLIEKRRIREITCLLFQNHTPVWQEGAVQSFSDPETGINWEIHNHIVCPNCKEALFSDLAYAIMDEPDLVIKVIDTKIASLEKIKATIAINR